jgi:hypothetical protein
MWEQMADKNVGDALAEQVEQDLGVLAADEDLEDAAWAN